MTALQAAVLGAVQGLAEFLPISSSAHLILVPRLLGWADQGLSYDVALHWGTLAALAICFWRDWLRLLGEARSGSALLWRIAAASVPAALAGLILDDLVETRFRSPALIAGTLASFGILLAAAERLGRQNRGPEGLDWRVCLGIGLAQALAIVPGVSRSGITITAGLLLGLRREEAARFSFLLAAPITFGAGLMKLRDVGPEAMTMPFWIGIAVSGATGAAAIWGLLRYVRSRSLLPFVIYRVVLAGAIVALL